MRPATRVLVTGGTGNVGREVVRALAAHDIEPVVAARDTSVPRRRAALGELYVERVHLDFSDRSTFASAARGCDALFLLRPPAISKVDSTLIPLVEIARSAGVRHVVFLSVAGAEKNSFVPHHAVERHLLAEPDSCTILRPGFFAQNLGDAYLRDIVEDARLYVPAGHGEVTFVDVRDVAEVAARCFATPSAHAGQAYTLTGPRAITFDDVARILSSALGRSIRYQPASIPGYLHHTVRRRGLPLAQALVQTVLHVGLRFGQAAHVDPTLERLLEAPPRTMDRYVSDHVELFASSAATP